jgi:hypothetical protein
MSKNLFVGRMTYKRDNEVLSYLKLDLYIISGYILYYRSL